MPVSVNALHLPQAGAVVVHDDLEQLSVAVARRIVELAAEAIAERGTFRVALAGGETPRRCYEKLRDLPVDWARVQIYFGDERCLPEGDAQRNDSMALGALLEHVAIPPENIHRLQTELGADEAAARYSVLLAQAMPLDLVLLGMGEDGHTASLFPGNPAMEGTPLAVAVFNAPKPPAERVSLGLEALNAARHKIFLVAGAGKRDALERISRGEPLPAARITGAEWHLDREAAGGVYI